LLGIHAEGSVEAHKNPKISGSVDVGFESTGCCAIGLFAGASELSNKNAKDAANETAPDATGADKPSNLQAIEGGLELGVTVPLQGYLKDRLRLRGRAGKAGTPPGRTSFGRAGFSGSLALIVRTWDIEAPATNAFSPKIDLLIGYSVLSLQRESTSAGDMKTPYADKSLMLGIRIGADHGLDLE